MKFNGLIKNWLLSTVRLEIVTSKGETAHGTAFYIVMRAESEEPNLPLLVTCRHVVEDAVKMRFFTFLQSEEDPRVPDFSTPKRSYQWDVTGSNKGFKWIPHPDGKVDLAAVPAGALVGWLDQKGEPGVWHACHEDSIADQEFLESMDASDEVVFMGYPRGIFDSASGLPIVRRGHLATLPELDFGGHPVFLIDASVFPGSSGSPVWSYTEEVALGDVSYKTRKQRCRLLGFVTGSLSYWSDGPIVFPSSTDEPYAEFKESLDLGVVVRADQLRALKDSCYRYYKDTWGI